MAEGFCDDCPLVIDHPGEDTVLADRRKIDFYTDGRMVFRPEAEAGECTAPYISVDREAAAYLRLMDSVERCEGPDKEVPGGLIRRVLAWAGLKQVSSECSAAAKHFDYTSRRQIMDYFGQESICR